MGQNRPGAPTSDMSFDLKALLGSRACSATSAAQFSTQRARYTHGMRANLQAPLLAGEVDVGFDLWYHNQQYFRSVPEQEVDRLQIKLTVGM